MAEEPSFPKNTAVGAKASNAADERARRKRQLIGAGIGSAAIVAALLYANRSRRSGDRGDKD
jgi:hypothetical protein